MKYIMFIAIILVCISFGRQPGESCKIVQRYYLHGKLVHVQNYDSIITEHGCLNYFSVKGKDLWADSIVTSLK